MKKSEAINELATALALAQGVMAGAKKDSKNHYSKYADLASVWEACRESLSKNGLSVSQLPEDSETGVSVETILMHSSGQWISGVYSIPVGKKDAQSIGSAITYARRYALSAMVGIAPEDDDGNEASKDHLPDLINDREAESILSLIDESRADEKLFLKMFNIESVMDLPSKDYETAVSALKRKIEKNKNATES